MGLRNLGLGPLVVHVLSHTLLYFVFIIMSVFLVEGPRVHKLQAPPPPNLDPPYDYPRKEVFALESSCSPA